MTTPSVRRWSTPVALVVAGWLIGVVTVFGASFEEMRSAAAKRCETIDPSAYQTGLFFNPDGYRSYYVRSECLQRIAIEFRDLTLCAQVKQRYSLFSSSWGYSKAQCSKLVREGIAADEKILLDMKQRYRQGAMQLHDFRIERNGNGRDFDIIPAFSGHYGHSYILRFELFRNAADKQALPIHASGYYVDGKSNLRIFVRREDIRKRFSDLILGRTYTVRATVILDVGNGGQAGKWSDKFIERVFPERERSQYLDRVVRF